MDIALLIGRILLVILFVIGGIEKLLDVDATVGYMQAVAPVLPQPMVLAILAGLLELIGGILIIVGWQTRLVAVIMLIYVAVVTYFFHAFWAMPADAPNYIAQMIQAQKNLAIVGGLFLLAGAGAGGLSLDGRKAAATM